MVKHIIAVVVGVFAGMAAMIAITYLSNLLYPIPDGVDTSDPVVMRAYIELLPIGAKLIVLFSWMVSAFVGGLVGAKLAPEGKGRIVAINVGALLMLGGVINAFSIPHPMWMLIIGLLQYIPLAHLGAKAVEKR